MLFQDSRECWWDLRVSYKPGKELYIADTLSRAYLKEQSEPLLEDELQVNSLSVCLPISKEKLTTFRTATAEDEELQMVMEVVQSGWPADIRQIPADIRKYWTFREELTCSDGLLFKSWRIVVPQSLRADMLARVHESHLGIVKCKERARYVMFWPSMAKQIEDVVLMCAICNTFRRSNTKEKHQRAVPLRQRWKSTVCGLLF